MTSTNSLPHAYTRFIVLGAQSAMAQAFIEAVAPNAKKFVLVGRHRERLETIARNVSTRYGIKCHIETCDLVAEVEMAAALMSRWQSQVGDVVDCVLVCHGYLGKPYRASTDLTDAKCIIDTNFMSAALWSVAAASVLKQNGDGRLLVVGSVAGDRGKKSNFIYGSAKSALETLVQGLNDDLSTTMARAVLIKPGYTDTPMTNGFAKSSFLWSTPDRIAKVMVKALQTRRSVLYAPSYWRVIMFIIRHMPDFIFRKLGL